jgi:hypothetical protein
MSTADELRPDIYEFYISRLRKFKISNISEISSYVWKIVYNTVHENLHGVDIYNPEILKEVRLGVRKLAEDTNLWLFSQMKLSRRLVRMSGIDDPKLLEMVIGLNTVQTKSVINTFSSNPMLAIRDANRYRMQRAGIIAGTESVKWEAAAKLIAWKIAIANGVLHPGIRMEWKAKIDARTCKRCLHMNGQTTPVDWMFLTPEGFYIASSPLHPSCRCKIILVGGDHGRLQSRQVA